MSKIDLSQPPYQVPCPVCKALAMPPCNLMGSRHGIQETPHDVRWAHWGLSPNLRVVVTNDTYTRWAETFQEWTARMVIHCPTAHTYAELMFFAAEKLDLTTHEYQEKYFPEMSDLNLSITLHHGRFPAHD